MQYKCYRGTSGMTVDHFHQFFKEARKAEVVVTAEM